MDNVNITNMLSKFFQWLLIDEQQGLVNFVDSDKTFKECILNAANLLQQQIDGKTISKEEWIMTFDAVQSTYPVAPNVYAVKTALCAADVVLDVNADFVGSAFVDAISFAIYTVIYNLPDDEKDYFKEMYARELVKKLLQLLKEAK